MIAGEQISHDSQQLANYATTVDSSAVSWRMGRLEGIAY